MYNNKKSKSIIVLILALLMVIIGQHIYYSSDVADKVEANNQLITTIGDIKNEYQIDEINQVDKMNRDIMQAQYDLDVLRKQKQEVYYTIQTPPDKITNPQNYYEIIDGIVAYKQPTEEQSHIEELFGIQ